MGSVGFAIKYTLCCGVGIWGGAEATQLRTQEATMVGDHKITMPRTLSMTALSIIQAAHALQPANMLSNEVMEWNELDQRRECGSGPALNDEEALFNMQRKRWSY